VASIAKRRAEPAAPNTYILRAKAHTEMQKFDGAIRDYDRAMDPKGTNNPGRYADRG